MWKRRRRMSFTCSINWENSPQGMEVIGPRFARTGWAAIRPAPRAQAKSRDPAATKDPTGKSLLIIGTRSQAPRSKKFPFYRNKNQAIFIASRPTQRGIAQRSPVRDGDAVDADGALDQGA